MLGLAVVSKYFALGCLLLFLPTLHPWYLVLMAPFLVFFPSRAWLYLQAAVVLTFPVIAVEMKSAATWSNADGARLSRL